MRSDSSIVGALRIDGTNYFSEAKITPGGSGNVAAAVSWLGGRVAFIGKSGNDTYGRFYREGLESNNVISRIEIDSLVPTGLAVCLVEPSGRRTMLVSWGANNELTPEEVKRNLAKIGRSRFLYLPGYSLVRTPQRDAILEAARLGRELGSRIVFDPGASNLIRSFPSAFKKAIGGCDILCANLSEIKALARGRDSRQYARLLSSRGKLVIIKRGRKGCIIAEGGQTAVVSGVRVRTVDTTGAGDAFIAAFLYSLSRNHGLKVSAAFANWFAAKTTEGLGPRHFPPRQEAQSYLRSVVRRLSEKGRGSD